MSTETKATLDAAIAAHFADEMDGALVHGYVLQITGDSIEDVSLSQWSALREVAAGQPFITSLGLIQYAARALDIAMTKSEREL